MPTYIEELAASVEDAPLVWKFQPLPRLTPLPEASKDIERYEIITVGAGPAGTFFNLLLARYGLPSTSRLHIDASPHSCKGGHADGVVLRTLEVLKSLDLADGVLNNSAWIYEGTIWKSDREKEDEGIKKSDMPGAPKNRGVGRWPHFVCGYHMGWVIKHLEEDLKKYQPEAKTERNTKIVGVRIDEEGDREFPVVAEIENGGKTRSVRAKYLIGADGAHSVVRKSMGIKMEGSNSDDLYGVVDFVVDTNWPDLRRMGNIEREVGNMLLIPRERNLKGQWLTRCYVPFASHVASAEAGDSSVEKSQGAAEAQMNLQARKAGVTKAAILKRVEEMMQPYRFKPKEGTEIEWWAAYQVGQRVAETLGKTDSAGHPRVFLMGDACHTHSPKEGQGMNVSMMDAFDLSWKMAYVLHGLAANPTELLNSYVVDRGENAATLIEMDKRWYANRYSRTGRSAPTAEVMVVELWDFLLGTGVEYSTAYLTAEKDSGPDKRALIKSENYPDGVLREGRRFAPAVFTRFADSNPRNIQDELRCDGRYRVVCFLGDETKDLPTSVAKLLDETRNRYQGDMVDLLVVQTVSPEKYSWLELPVTMQALQDSIEMNVLYGSPEVYDFYGIDKEKGALVVVRPDQFVGTIVSESGEVEAYLDTVLVRA